MEVALQQEIFLYPERTRFSHSGSCWLSVQPLFAGPGRTKVREF